MNFDSTYKVAFRRRAYRGFEPVIIIAVLFCSSLALGLFVVYVCWFTSMSVFSRIFYIALLLGLFYCCLSYEVNRFGASIREARRRPFSEDTVPHLFKEDGPSITVLIPSYREERRVVVTTILSAALAQYSNRRIVLLVDDPPSDGLSRERTLGAVDEVKGLLARPMDRFTTEAEGWSARLKLGQFFLPEEAVRLATSYRYAATWLDNLAIYMNGRLAEGFAHVDRFFINQIVRDLARRFRRHADDLFVQKLDPALISREYHRLATLFCTDIVSFERKQFDNLSHAPNKAMNLNSYIGLLGGRYRTVAAGDKCSLVDAGDKECDLAIDDTDYVLTLDADSVVRHTYMLELVDILERNPGFGVAQTPYLTFPNSTASVERVAGATTDVQYLVHQGTTYFNASYWVGANALIRNAALRAIRREEVESGKSVQVFIQDETVIEDTGSTVDLLHAGWTVHNHYEPLAYSATPADFGALVIQRKRWSNGGLIVLPMLLKQYLNGSDRVSRFLEFMLRANYLLSPTIGNAAVFLLMIWTSVDGKTLVWTPLIMLPYFVLYGLDLRRLGYRFREVFAVCALNLMLLPVGFAGVGASIRQMITGQKGRFSRTPKVVDRTFIPPAYFLFNLAMSVLMLRYVVDGIVTRDFLGSIVPLVNVTFYIYGIVRFVGLFEGLTDVGLAAVGLLRWAYRPFAARINAVLDRAGGLIVLVPRPALAALTFALVVLVPWDVRPSVVEGNLAHAAAVGRQDGATLPLAKPAGGAPGMVHAAPKMTLTP